jgi:hypothetical protein
MSRQDHVLTVFLASPGDVQPEREKVEEVIHEFNVMWSRPFRIRLELVRWESHAYPGIGTDAQAVINDQIQDDYDVFIGIMWHRYGTPTGRAGSGTAEEFDRAHARYKRDPSSINLMFYFKDSEPISEHTDPIQIAKVREFQSALQSAGVLYWTFSSLDHFEKLTRIHLARQVQNSGAFKALIVDPPIGSKPTKKAKTTTPDLAFSRTGDNGAFAAMMRAHQAFVDGALDSMTRSASVNAVLAAYRKETADTVKGINALTVMMTADRSKVAEALIALPQLITQLEKSLIELANGLDRELPLYGAASSTAMDAFIGSAVARIGMGRNTQLLKMHEGSLQGVLRWRDVTEQLQKATQSASDSTLIIPDATEGLATAKRKVMLALGRLIVLRGNELVLLREGEILIRDLLGRPA